MTGRTEEGAALLTVLMLVALMAALMAVAFDRTGIALNRTRLRLASREAQLDLFSAEAVAVARLNRLLGDPANAPAAADLIGRGFATPVPGGTVKARLSDGGNCFNLNAMVTAAPDGRFVAQPLIIDQFARLARLLGMSDEMAVPLARRVADWIDSDAVPLDGSVEAVGPMVANRPIIDVRELKAVPGFPASLFVRLQPLLCALPEPRLTAYNVNTLTAAQVPLVVAIFPRGTDSAAVAQALAARPARGYADGQAFLAHPALRGVDLSGEASIQLNTRTDWFLLDLDAQLGDAGQSERVLIDARTRPVHIVRRILGTP